MFLIKPEDTIYKINKVFNNITTVGKLEQNHTVYIQIIFLFVKHYYNSIH
jgi:predicted type IV restriction endonuclease